MKANNRVNQVFDLFLSQKTKERSEEVILAIAILSYIAHLVLIALTNFGIVDLPSKFLKNPIAAIYTPFSFILVYEVYLLIFFLPKSISFYIGKQYEIITLIVIRRIFKDIANLELSSNWFHSKSDLQFTYDTLTSLILFLLIYYFYQNRATKNIIRKDASTTPHRIETFIHLKKALATLLVPILILLALYSFADWAIAVLRDYHEGISALTNINNIFFDEFFTILIIIDVLLLLASFFYSDEFHKIIRNSGFVISTILIKISFSVEGIVNNAIIIGAVLFGFLILRIHNIYEKNYSTVTK